jgi:hypothetical protein
MALRLCTLQDGPAFMQYHSAHISSMVKATVTDAAVSMTDLPMQNVLSE